MTYEKFSYYNTAISLYGRKNMEEHSVEQLPEKNRKLLNKDNALYKRAVLTVKLRRVCVVLLVTGIFCLASMLLFGDIIDLGLPTETCANIVFWLYISAIIIAVVASVTVSIIPVESCTTAQLNNKTLPILAILIWVIAVFLPHLFKALQTIGGIH